MSALCRQRCFHGCLGTGHRTRVYSNATLHVLFVQAEGASRDVLLLDIALDNYFRLCIERTDKNSLEGDGLMDLVGLVLSNACTAGESEDFGQVRLVTSVSCVSIGTCEWPCCKLAWLHRVSVMDC